MCQNKLSQKNSIKFLTKFKKFPFCDDMLPFEPAVIEGAQNNLPFFSQKKTNYHNQKHVYKYKKVQKDTANHSITIVQILNLYNVMRPFVWSSHFHRAMLQMLASSLFYLVCCLYHYPQLFSDIERESIQLHPDEAN